MGFQMSALICLLKRSKRLSGHKLFQTFELYFRTCPAIFLQLNEFEFYWGAVFSHIFMIFELSIWRSVFGHAKTGSGAKKRVVLRPEIFSI